MSDIRKCLSQHCNNKVFAAEAILCMTCRNSEVNETITKVVKNGVDCEKEGDKMIEPTKPRPEPLSDAQLGDKWVLKGSVHNLKNEFEVIGVHGEYTWLKRNHQGESILSSTRRPLPDYMTIVERNGKTIPIYTNGSYYAVRLTDGRNHLAWREDDQWSYTRHAMLPVIGDVVEVFNRIEECEWGV